MSGKMVVALNKAINQKIEALTDDIKINAYQLLFIL